MFNLDKELLADMIMRGVDYTEIEKIFLEDFKQNYEEVKQEFKTEECYKYIEGDIDSHLKWYINDNLFNEDEIVELLLYLVFRRDLPMDCVISDKNLKKIKSIVSSEIGGITEYMEKHIPILADDSLTEVEKDKALLTEAVASLIERLV